MTSCLQEHLLGLPPPPPPLPTAHTGSAAHRSLSTAGDEDPSAPCQAHYRILHAGLILGQHVGPQLEDAVLFHHLPDQNCLILGADPWSLCVSTDLKGQLVQFLLGFFVQYSHEEMSKFPLHTSSDGGLIASPCNPLCLEIILLVRNHSQICFLIISPHLTLFSSWVLPFNAMFASCFLEVYRLYLFSQTTWPLGSCTGLHFSESPVPCAGLISQEVLKQ